MVIQSEILCATFLIHLFGEQYSSSFLPRGNCDYCCPFDLTKDVKYFSFTTKNPNLPYELSSTDFEYNLKIFENSKYNIFYIHGFSENYNGASSIQLKNALLSLGYTVTIVDWSPMATMPWYDRAVDNIEPVGQAIASWLDSMTSHGLKLQTIHLVAFSLGTEVAGYVGHYFNAGRLPRITALDPAHGAHTHPTIGRRITTDDAKFVDVIHTDSGPLGLLAPQGHVDFFPNMGVSPQPGCTLNEILSTGRLWEIVACSHNRAWRYFIESITYPYSFPAIAMGNVQQQPIIAYMGITCSNRSRGMYYLNTSSHSPYGLGSTRYFDPF